MNRKSIVKEIIERYNNREGNITELSNSYEGYSRQKFYRDIKKYGIVKDDDNDIYIIPEDNIKGQIDLLEGTEGPESHNNIKAIDNIPNKEIKATERDKGVKAMTEVKDTTKKKKTFEIDVELEKHIRIQAAIEDTTINEWVNKTLWEAIPEDTKEFIGD